MPLKNCDSFYVIDFVGYDLEWIPNLILCFLHLMETFWSEKCHFECGFLCDIDIISELFRAKFDWTYCTA